MINDKEILETLHMIENEHLDVRTITMGISLFDCCDPDPKAACRKIVDKICSKAEHLVRTGEEIEKEYGIPIINKRISVTPMAMIAAASKPCRKPQTVAESISSAVFPHWYIRDSPKAI